MPDQALVPTKLPGDVALTKTLLVERNDPHYFRFADPSVPHLDAAVPEQLDHRAAG